MWETLIKKIPQKVIIPVRHLLTDLEGELELRVHCIRTL